MKSQFRICYSTGDIFDGRNIQDVWRKEDKNWKDLIERYPDYNFPQLERSVYSGNGNNTTYNDLSSERCTILQSLQWSYDGMSLISVTNDTGIRQYLLPEEDIEDSNNANNDDYGNKNILTPFTRVFKNKSIVSSALNPRYSLYGGGEESETNKNNFILLASRDLPIQMLNLSVDNYSNGEHGHNKIINSYDIMNSDNEKYEVPYSMKMYANETDKFYCGTNKNKVLIYDLNRKAPVITIGSGPKRGAKYNNYKSIISCFEERMVGSDSNIINGQHTKVVGNYRSEIFTIDTREYGKRSRNQTSLSNRRQFPTGGNGIYQILRSFNGNYLYILRRKCNNIIIVDVRNSSRQLDRLSLPFRIDNQKHIASMDESYGLTLGTNDGRMLNWDKTVIEFGGLLKNNKGKPDDELIGISSYDEIPIGSSQQYSSRRVHTIARNPANPSMIAAATSCDKLAYDSKAQACLSGFIVGT